MVSRGAFWCSGSAHAYRISMTSCVAMCVEGHGTFLRARMHSRPTWLIDISPFSDKCDGYFQRCDWYFQMLLVFSDLNHGLKACL